ncbi:hypothetical protein PTNB73_09782 [Pyrenophora teres f. teres]|nr:hypothetical protein HRS9139_10038 [Pyrenophora teres f. teres]KAE8826172.1 hypothetical protein PTNB85_09117 [Pyrenophora teres f. teres]KAE8832816.1 hypothetical protein HRS9122_08529 [Pyrenophora teres f. teres]KAE8852768.1 hypothetical protein PTNB29_10158 [Pyrenophora teres f. teres]KAE8856517.1 hypothetical protein PTNB73_09782 [Pyrenophora teres f. teres]
MEASGLAFWKLHRLSTASKAACLTLATSPVCNGMAQVVAHSNHANPPYGQQNAPHGKKRPADSSLEHEQRLSKRFDLLNLVDNNGTRLYIPVPGSTDATLPRPPASPTSGPDPLTFVAARHNKRGRRPHLLRPQDDGMEVEDTPNRVYISDLSAELSDIESDEENPIFLSDIEKHLSKIPRHVLVGPDPKPNEHNQVVLYNVPTSLTVPEAQDNVRKAIVEARQRIRDRQANPNTEPIKLDFGASSTSSNTGGPSSAEPMMMSDIPPTTPMEEDGDAMDID